MVSMMDRINLTLTESLRVKHAAKQAIADGHERTQELAALADMMLRGGRDILMIDPEPEYTSVWLDRISPFQRWVIEACCAEGAGA